LLFLNFKEPFDFSICFEMKQRKREFEIAISFELIKFELTNGIRMWLMFQITNCLFDEQRINLNKARSRKQFDFNLNQAKAN